jgi:hypothetical protein
MKLRIILKNTQKIMGSLLEVLKFKKNPEKHQKKEYLQGKEKYLQDALDQYKMNLGNLLRNTPETLMGPGHAEDTRSISALENSLVSLKKIIIREAQELGKDSEELIAEAEEAVGQIQERRKVA